MRKIVKCKDKKFYYTFNILFEKFFNKPKIRKNCHHFEKQICYVKSNNIEIVVYTIRLLAESGIHQSETVGQFEVGVTEHGIAVKAM